MMTLIFLMGLAALALTYRLIAAVAPRPVAVLVTLLTGTSFTLLEWMYHLLNEIPAFLGMIAALAAFEVLTSDPPGQSVYLTEDSWGSHAPGRVGTGRFAAYCHLAVDARRW
jgi:hypothetical protein